MAYQGFDLTGKMALVTGGNSGIGLGMALAMAQAGAAVCIWGTNEDKNAAALAKLTEHGGPAMALRCDVSDEAAVDRCFAETIRGLGRVDSCFANAGVSGRGGAMGFAEMATAEWRRVMSVNLDGAFFTLRAAARHMIERGGGGSLVSTASLAAVMGAARSEHYSAAKGALMAMTRSMAVELVPPDPREFHRAGLDRHADDREGASRRGLHAEGAAARARAPLGRRRRLRRHCRLPRERCLALSHRRHIRDRRRLPHLLAWPAMHDCAALR